MKAVVAGLVLFLFIGGPVAYLVLAHREYNHLVRQQERYQAESEWLDRAVEESHARMCERLRPQPERLAAND